MTAIVDNGFARITKETLVRNPSTPGAITGNDIAYNETNTINEIIDTVSSSITSGTVTSISSTSSDATITNPTTTPAITIVSAPKLKTARNINGVAFDGTGDITISDSTKVVANTAITGATKTKITYDAKGLVTSGADATTADIAASTDKNYVTDAQLVVIGNTSGTNSGNQTIANTSDATSHTATLSATGGSLKIVEGANITITTTGTSADGIITIASSGGMTKSIYDIDNIGLDIFQYARRMALIF